MSASDPSEEAPWNLLFAEDVQAGVLEVLLRYPSPWRGMRNVPEELAQAVMDVLQNVDASGHDVDAQWMTLITGTGPDLASRLRVP